MQTKRPAPAYGKIILSLGGTALLLAGCAQKPPPAVVYVPPPAPVGHVFPVAVALPPPVSHRIKFTPTQEEQAQQAFNLVGLKSALMVAAYTCSDEDRYDAFMNAFKPHILAEMHVMDAYFRKASGPYSGQDMEDKYTTLLANNVSDQANANTAAEVSFCLNSTAEYNAVMALPTPAALDNFVTDAAPAMNTTVATTASP